MTVKLFEVRDRATFLPVIAIRLDLNEMTEQELYLIRSAGHPIDANYSIGVFRLEDGSGSFDPFMQQRGRTLKEVHLWLQGNFDTTASGQVLDVEYILGETPTPKISASQKELA